LTQLSYEEYNDTKHPTTQSNDLVTSPCQLWNLNAFGCSFMIKYGYIRHDWEWAYKTCIVLAQRWLAQSLQSGSSSVPPKKIWDRKKTICTKVPNISPITLPWHVISWTICIHNNGFDNNWLILNPLIWIQIYKG
jgi:hypothetical protein